MTIEEQSVDARKRLAVAEETILHALADARAAVTAQDEALREAKRAAARRDDDFLTEEEFAGILKVSPATIAKLRKKEMIEPIWIGSMPRYSRTEHVAKAEEIFKRKPKGIGRGRKAEGKS